MLKSLFLFGCTFSTALAAGLPLERIHEITGLSGKWNQQEAVYKVTSPRNDVEVSVDQWRMPPFMGLTSWAAFTPGKERTPGEPGRLKRVYGKAQTPLTRVLASAQVSAKTKERLKQEKARMNPFALQKLVTQGLKEIDAARQLRP